MGDFRHSPSPEVLPVPRYARDYPVPGSAPHNHHAHTAPTGNLAFGLT